MRRQQDLRCVAFLILVLALVPIADSAAQSPPCPVFTISQIDYAYAAWEDSIKVFDEGGTATCHDDPGVPETHLEMDDMLSGDSRFLIFVQRDVAGCLLQISGETFGCVSEQSEKVVHDIDGHSCRAQILESQTWQRLCQSEYSHD